MEERIRGAVERALKEAGAPDVAFTVEWPADMAHGDYAVNAALAAAKKLRQNPRDIANGIADAVRNTLGADAARVEVAGAGFVNIMLSQSAIMRAIQEALSKGDAWGKGTANAS